jgi:hypothetical protein
MSRLSAVQAAITTQLAADGRNYPIAGSQVMSDPIPKGFGYDSITIKNFLAGVSIILAADSPRYTFVAASLDVNRCLADTISQLTGDINANTTP